MFSIENKTEQGFDKIILRDNISGTSAHIIPSCGAILHSFIIFQNGKIVNVIHSYENTDYFKIKVNESFLGCKLSPFVCRLLKGKYHFAGKDYQLQKLNAGDNALHGKLYDQPFIIIDTSVHKDKASVTMKYDYRTNDFGYPFNYSCIIKYELEKDNKLNIATEIINIDKVPIPIQDGWHPYFRLSNKIDNLELQFHSKELAEFNQDLVSTGIFTPFKEYNTFRKIGVKALDNCFTLNFAESQPLCSLRSAKNKIQLEIYPEESYPYLQIYIPPDRKSISIENLSSVPDGFNNGIGLKILSPKQSMLFKTSYKVRLL